MTDIKLPYYGTKVSVEQSQLDIQKLLKKFGIEKAFWGHDGNTEILTFEIKTSKSQKRVVKMMVPEMLYEQRKGKMPRPIKDKQKYRLFYHSLQGILTGTTAGIFNIEDIFLADTVVNFNGQQLTMKQIRPNNIQFLTEGE